MSNPGLRNPSPREEGSSAAAQPGARVRTVLITAALVWALGCFFWELGRISSPPPSPPRADTRPSRWTLRSPHVAKLAGFLSSTDTALPAGSLVTVAGRPLPNSQDFFLYLWTAYFLPHHDAVRARHRWSLDRADYLLTYDTTLETLQETDPDLTTALRRPAETVVEHPLGRVYRLAPVDPAARGGPAR